MTTMTEVTFAEAAATGAGVVEAARGILRRAKACPWPDDAQARADRQAAVWPLAEALVTYDLMRVGIIRPGDKIPGLGAGPGGLAEALARVAEGATRDAAVLAEVIERHCGDEAGAKARGEGGEQS